MESTHKPVYILPPKHNLSEWIFLTPCFEEALSYYFGFWALHITLQIKGISFTLIMLSQLSYSVLQIQTKNMPLCNIHFELCLLLPIIFRAYSSNSPYKSRKPNPDKFPLTRDCKLH